MNEWVRRSIELANSPGYLDRLHQIYPASLEVERHISPKTKEALKQTHEQRNEYELMRILLTLEKFPLADPYIGFLLKNPVFLSYNPQTVRRIATRLFSLGFEEMIGRASEPKMSSRQIGQAFRTWLRTLGHPILPEKEFGSYKGIALLWGTNGQLMQYANTVLGCNLSKRPDMVAKKGSVFIVGEAKFLTRDGGNQNSRFEEAMNLLRGKEGNAKRIAILDGVVWVPGRTLMHRGVCQLEEEVALSALLLKDFLESL